MDTRLTKIEDRVYMGNRSIYFMDQRDIPWDIIVHGAHIRQPVVSRKTLENNNMKWSRNISDIINMSYRVNAFNRED